MGNPFLVLSRLAAEKVFELNRHTIISMTITKLDKDHISDHFVGLTRFFLDY